MFVSFGVSAGYYDGTEGLTGNTDWYDGVKVDVWEALVYRDSACPDSEPKCGLVTLLYLDDVRRIDQANRGKS